MNNQAASSPGSAEAEVIRRFLATLRKTETLPPEALVAYQRGLLERLVRHARDHVPFYRDSGRLRPLFQADDSIDWQYWPQIEPVTRADIQNEHDRLQSEFLGPEHGRTWTLTTSGSTGEPVKVVHTELSGRLAWTAMLLRDFERHRIDPTRRTVKLLPIKPDELDITSTRKHDAWLPNLALLGMFGERFDLADTRPARELVEAVVALKPTYLQVQPTALELMIACDPRQALAQIGVEAVICHGEYLSRAARREVERHVGARLLDLYGSNECGNIAGTCPHCDRYHVNAESMLVEVIDEGGRACAAGDVGDILVTPLYNYAMPLIRYDHADEGRLAAVDGTCKIALPVLDEIFGKKREPFIFADDRAMRPTLPTDAIMAHLGARMFQVAQVAPDRCEFRIVPGSLSPADMQFDRMTELLREMWWNGLKVDYRIVDQIPRRSPRGKIQQYVREMATLNNDKIAVSDGPARVS